ncbi:MAG: class I SAM-dependent methyltransferase [Deltaproteobacteria bacterium]|nr:class I SAM-dependent methyltransferase [Deltaproteobacteria bacterium]
MRTLYERFPYPKKLEPEDFENVYISANPKDSYSLYFPTSPFRDDLDILIAGCGTNLLAAFGSLLPNARIVGIDISQASLDYSKKIIDKLALKNCELHQMPLESVGNLDRMFDFVHCHGVLHHLKSPDEGIRALGSVLRQDGAMSLMVYALYGRSGLYQLQELCRRLNLSTSVEHAKVVQQFITTIPRGHSFGIVQPNHARPLELEEIADMLLHPRDIAYTTEDVGRLVEDNGLSFHRWITQGAYSPEISPLWSEPMISTFEGMTEWQRAAAMELYYGVIFKHGFIVTHPSRPKAGELFPLDKLQDAVPMRSPDLKHRSDKQSITLFNSTQQLPISVTFKPGLEMMLLKEINGESTVNEIVEKICADAGNKERQQQCLQIIQHLYLSDIIYLKLNRPI